MFSTAHLSLSQVECSLPSMPLQVLKFKVLTVALSGIAVLMVVNLVIFLRVASRYQYKTVARKREAPVHRRPQWLQPQVVDGIVIPVRGL